MKKNTKGGQGDAMVIPPTRENVKSSYDKPKLYQRIEEYYPYPEMLKEFVWYLMNNAWTDGYNTPNFD